MIEIFKKVCTDAGIPSEIPFYEACKALKITLEERKDGSIFASLPLSLLADDYLLRGQLYQEIEALYQKYKEQNKKQQWLFPLEWIQAIDTLKTRPRPKRIKDERWGSLILRLDRLIEQEADQLLKMVEYDWPLQEVFGCHKFAPDVRIDGMGLLMLLKEAAIADITPDKAILRHKGGATTSYTLGAFKAGTEYHTLMDID